MRPTTLEVAIATALEWSKRSTCARRAVGCVLLDKKGRVLSIGYNGVATGLPHCNEGFECEGIQLTPGQDKCEGIHAEQNALLQCKDIDSIHTAVVTTSPCRACVKLFLNTSCQNIAFITEWTDPLPKQLWEKMGRLWTCVR